MKVRNPLGTFVIGLTVSFGLPIYAARALSPTDTACRSDLAAGVVKLARDTIDQLGSCHERRLRGHVGPATDCNDTANVPAPLRLSRDANSLARRADRRCDAPPASSPATLGFPFCVVPCDAEVPAVADAATLLAMQAAMEDVVVENSVGGYIVALTAATRAHPNVLVGASPRGSLALMLMARAVAAMAGRDFVVPEDVQRVAVAALAHRVTLRPEMWLRRVDATQIVTQVLGSVPTPLTAALPTYGGA